MTSLTLPGTTSADVRMWLDEEAMVRKLYWHPAEGDVVIDVGAHYGSWTLPALAAGASVVAVDPYPEFTGVLAGLAAAIPEVDESKLTIVNLALAAGPGGYPPEIAAGQAASPHQYIYPQAGHVFSTLDGVARGLGRLDWVKIDVEGGESAVLDGGRAALARHHPTVITEDHTSVYPWVGQMGSTGRCLGLLQDLGYRTECWWHTGGTAVERLFWISWHEH